MILIAALSVLSQFRHDINRSLASLNHSAYSMQIDDFLSGSNVMDRSDYRLEQRAPNWASVEVLEGTNEERVGDLGALRIFQLKGDQLLGYEPIRNIYFERKLKYHGNALNKLLTLAGPDVLAPQLFEPELLREKGWSRKVESNLVSYSRGIDDKETVFFDLNTGNLVAQSDDCETEHYRRSFYYAGLRPRPMLVLPKNAIRMNGLRDPSKLIGSGQDEFLNKSLDLYEKTLRMHVIEHCGSATFIVDRDGSSVSEVGPGYAWAYDNGILRIRRGKDYQGHFEPTEVATELAVFGIEPQRISIDFLLDVNFLENLFNGDYYVKQDPRSLPSGNGGLIIYTGNGLRVGIDFTGVVRLVSGVSASDQSYEVSSFEKLGYTEPENGAFTLEPLPKPFPQE